ncbi:XRE family transcriptional regulator [Mycobacteroides abscessus]|uniref:XRE family transcriptional regulator n=1 Tax=Mycobacteroides abscessus TaxID=36809 RepID=UPI000929F18A|nr:XRE family transcriptional regulator [Mycobacteroides abscessus]SHS36999.1 helix-turn-helix domain-containing protein [Mycobacteroides abscessus subsp. abscessus]SHS52472.1 helix-turn-helix domain-containing protein [Mycobacteroides abscessus subsp. abscessus]SHS84868.1 helix-turn-helix domain-containing protein [Mycobacteroides abscessus subsp. abscessus]SHT05492.1 helix-turn-helix domain-containing protein [Mycobacteroides abscessus subsp. abscessus]SHT83728.1 helix-turn-helix domain-cont
MSVWDDIADTPREAAKLRLRSELMTAIEKHVAGWTRTAAAQALELTEPRVVELMQGKISKFSLDALVDMASELGILLRVDAAETTGLSFRTYSLADVAAMVLPPDLKSPEKWLARHLLSGRLRGYKVGRTWRMTHEDVEYLIESCRKRPPPAAPPPEEPERYPGGLTRRSWLYHQRYPAGNPNLRKKRGPRPKAQKDCQNPE